MSKKRSEERIARDRERIVELKIQGWGQCDIAEKLGLSQPTVARELKAFALEARRQMLRTISDHKATELARLNRIEAELWVAWEKSKTEGRKRSSQWVVPAEPTEGDPTPAPVLVCTSLTVETGAGNPRHIAAILTVVDRRIKLLSLDVPIKMELPSSLGDVSKMTVEQRTQEALEILSLCGPLPSVESITGC